MVQVKTLIQESYREVLIVFHRRTGQIVNFEIGDHRGSCVNFN